MIRRVVKPSFIGFITYFLGKDPKDMWEINLMGKKYTLINGWKSGAKLYHQNELILKNNEKFRIDSKKPFMAFSINNSKIEICAKAIFSLKINVSVNGHFIQRDYV